MVFDPALNYTFPLELTNQTNIPEESEDPIFFPTPLYTVANGSAIVSNVISQFTSILTSKATNCTKCISALEAGQYVAQRVPTLVPDLLVQLCISTKFGSNTSCHETYGAENYGAVYTQVLALAHVSGSDGQYLCNYISSNFCPRPFTLPSNTSAYFGPKPDNVTIPKPSGNRVKVIHMSDFHIDPRYDVGSEANCSSGLCCRSNNPKSASGSLEIPSSLYGAFKCDSPYFLLTCALQSIGPLTGTTSNNKSENDQFAWGIYTGDLVSHESQNELSNNYTEYAEVAIYHLIKSFIRSGPIFPVLGNHDTNPGKDHRTIHGALLIR